MPDFKIHSGENATGERSDALKDISMRYGRVPNVLGAMAESPAAIRGYLALGDALRASTLTPTERHVVWFTINRKHGCHYCMAAHTPHARTEDVAEDVIAAARNGTPYGDARLEALSGFTRTMVEKRGWLEPAEVDAFLAAGFTKENVFEIILAIAHKVMTNYTNHLVEPVLDEEFQPYEWTPAAPADKAAE
ncbi:MAG: carboxymuconolactone decarboxylase family protein [Hyphomicrobiaceae bacterium]